MTEIAELDQKIAAAEKVRASLEAAIRYNVATGFTGLDEEIRASAELKALKKKRDDLLNGVEVKAQPAPSPTAPNLKPDHPNYDIFKDRTPVRRSELQHILNDLVAPSIREDRHRIDGLEKRNTGQNDELTALQARVAALENEARETPGGSNDLEERIATLEERPMLEYAGVWTPREYHRGHVVTSDGGMWFCKAVTRSEPPGPDWQLCVKAGRNGKDLR
jgi:predicted nuclease with TOPRIM domain